MCSTNIRVLFVCKTCKVFYPKVAQFIEHKTENHFADFQKTSCIIFEESRTQYTDNDISEFSPVTIKSEIEPANDVQPIEASRDASVNVKAEPFDSDYDGEADNLAGNFDSDYENTDYNPFVDQHTSLQSNSGTKITNFDSENPSSVDLLVEAEISSSKNDSEATEMILLKPKSEFLINKNEASLVIPFSTAQDPFISLKKLTPDEIRAAISVVNTSERPKYPSKFLSECKLCLQTFNTEPELKLHVGICAKSHKLRKRYCVQCDIKFCSAQACKFHSLRFHSTAEEKSTIYKYECPICSKKYSQKVRLQVHLESHKNVQERVRSFKCHLCERSFTRRDTLTMHSKSHLQT